MKEMAHWMNFHSHTHYCDGSNPAIDYAREAIEQELPAYGYSSHAPVAFNTDWCIPDGRFKDYLNDVEEIKKLYGDKLQVYLGLEIDYIPGIAGRNQHLLKDAALDYFIGSVHFVDQFDDGRHWNIDTSFELFEEGLAKIFRNNYQSAATKFYELSRAMITEEKPNVIGHMDKIKMFNTKGNYFSEDEKWYQEQINLTINTLKNSNCIVEINTRGYYRYGQPELYPSEWIIEKLIRADIPIMINSDSHQPAEITEGMEYAASRLLSLGAKELYGLYDNKWQAFSFSQKGLNI